MARRQCPFFTFKKAEQDINIKYVGMFNGRYYFASTSFVFKAKHFRLLNKLDGIPLQSSKWKKEDQINKAMSQPCPFDAYKMWKCHQKVDISMIHGSWFEIVPDFTCASVVFLIENEKS